MEIVSRENLASYIEYQPVLLLLRKKVAEIHRMMGKEWRVTRERYRKRVHSPPCSRRIPRCIWSCWACWWMAGTGGYARRKSSRPWNRCRPCTYRRCAGCNRMCSKGPGKHGENERRRCSYTRDMIWGRRERNACPVVRNVCTYPSIVYFFFSFFLFFLEKYEEEQRVSRWMCFEKKRSLIVRTLSTFILSKI